MDAEGGGSVNIEEQLATYYEDANVLHRLGHTKEATTLRRIADEVTTALGDYLTWLSETEAALWSGKSERWLRERFDGWLVMGHARKGGRHRQYRAAILPKGVDYVGIREMARIDAEAA
jgi:hypothetical protein